MQPWSPWLSAAADLVVGADCAGCGAPGLDWCGACAHACRPAPRLIEAAEELPAVAAAENSGALARVVVAWKDRGRHRLGGALGHLLACSCLAVMPEAGRTALVPVPTARTQVRRRGTDPVLALAGAAALALESVAATATVLPLLRRVRPTADQVGLSVRQRRSNVAGAFAAAPDAMTRCVRGGIDTVVVVDDVWTTGASAREAVRALGATGIAAAGVAVVAATPPPGGATVSSR